MTTKTRTTDSIDVMNDKTVTVGDTVNALTKHGRYDVTEIAEVVDVDPASGTLTVEFERGENTLTRDVDARYTELYEKGDAPAEFVEGDIVHVEGGYYDDSELYEVLDSRRYTRTVNSAPTPNHADDFHDVDTELVKVERVDGNPNHNNIRVLVRTRGSGQWSLRQARRTTDLRPEDLGASEGSVDVTAAE